MHQPQPLHLSLSIIMVPVSSDCVRASRGQAATQAGSSQSLQVTAMFASWLMRTTRMRAFIGLNAFSFVQEQAYSQIWQPTHLSGSTETNFLSWIFTILLMPPFSLQQCLTSRPCRALGASRLWERPLMSIHEIRSSHPTTSPVHPD